MTAFTDYVLTIFGDHDREAVQELLLADDGPLERLEALVGTDVHLSSQSTNDDDETFYSVKGRLIDLLTDLTIVVTRVGVMSDPYSRELTTQVQDLIDHYSKGLTK